LPIIVLFVGILMYALCANPKLVWIGQVMFCCGLGATLLVGADRIVTLFSGH
jgi:hypothetical protein